ncbi:hypothetical protein DFH29DRAFT_798253, partial [Suillus ampliporus]
TERLKRGWTSPVYAFFEPTPSIEYTAGRRSHVFKCLAKGCKQHVQCFLDKGDAKSTSNMTKHIKSCWGESVYLAAQDAKTTATAHTTVVQGVLQTGSITSSFERKGKGKVTYSHRQHTKTETKNKGRDCTLMKMGCPKYYLPSPSTVLRDVKLVFTKVRQRVARMLQTYEGELNFATDAWTAPNHKVFAAISVHLEHEGEPLAMLLDIVEVSKVSQFKAYKSTKNQLCYYQSHTGLNLTEVFTKVLLDFGVSDKVDNIQRSLFNTYISS